MIYPALTKIRTFATVAAQGSFRKASEQLHLSQPALSTHIRDLEETLGVPLFHRTTRSVRLTAEGERFLGHAQRALDEIKSGIIESRDQAMLQRGRVIVACVPSVACHILPNVLPSFSKRHPGIEIQIHDGYAGDVVKLVGDRKADIGLGPFAGGIDDLNFHSLTHDRFVAVLPSNHALAANSKVQLKELIRYPLLTLATGTNVRALLEQALAKHDIPFRPALEVHHHYTLGGMVEAGLGITIVPSMAVSMLGHPPLKTADIVNPAISREVGIIQRRDQAATPAVKAFLRALLGSVKISRQGETARTRRNRRRGNNEQWVRRGSSQKRDVKNRPRKSIRKHEQSRK